MMKNEMERVGFACAYTPLALFEAAGYGPFRILPTDGPPDQAGQILHDNMCPHVKRILDRAFDGDLPDLAGMVFVNSCDAMRRAADAWEIVRPDDRVIRLDLPATADALSESFLAGEIKRVAQEIFSWNGKSVDLERIEASMARYDELAGLIQDVKNKICSQKPAGGGKMMQKIYNRASVEPLSEMINNLKDLISAPEKTSSPDSGGPIFLFGNVLPAPEAFARLESCGAFVADDDLCTGSRAFAMGDGDASGDICFRLAKRTLHRPRCARTFQPFRPDGMAEDIISRAKACNAKGVIGHFVKFCDPYLTRLPAVRKAMKDAGLPLLVIEGDCTLRSMGQQRTRIEAFIEMLR